MDEISIKLLANRFKETHRQLDHIGFPINWNQTHQFELIDPQSMVPHYSESEKQEIATILKAGENCNRDELHKGIKGKNKNVEKWAHWFRYQCEKVPLPSTLWTEAPYIHPLGGSWAHFLFKKGYGDKDWLIKQKKYLHVLELGDVAEESSDLYTKVVRSLKPFEFKRLLNGKAIVRSSDYLLHSTYFDTDTSWFHVFPRKDWDQFLTTNGMVMLDNANGSCQVISNNYCWDFVYKPVFAISKNGLQSSLVALFAALSLFFIIILWRKFREDQMFQEQQQLVMQTLAHELRHPVTSLRLSVEFIRPFYDQLPQEVDKEFFRLAATSKRMTRLVNFSQNYLQLLFKDGQFVFNKDPIESFNTFMETCIEEYMGKVEFNPSAMDVSCELDSYWASTCIKNLVVNALTYGEPPVAVEWRLIGKDIEVEVRDHGKNLTKELYELTKPQIAKMGTKGMGLGLSLIYRIVILMNGKMLLKKDPTRFIIQFKGVHREKNSAG